MGAYSYKVTSKKIRLTDGTFANLAVFAYKPHSWDDSMNGRMYFSSKCGAADRFVKGKNFTGKVVMGRLSDDGKTALVSMIAKKTAIGVFEDYLFDKWETVGTPVLINEDVDNPMHATAKVF